MENLRNRSTIDLVMPEEETRSSTPFKQLKFLKKTSCQSRVNAELIDICGICHPGSVKNIDM